MLNANCHCKWPLRLSSARSYVQCSCSVWIVRSFARCTNNSDSCRFGVKQTIFIWTHILITPSPRRRTNWLSPPIILIHALSALRLEKVFLLHYIELINFIETLLFCIRDVFIGIWHSNLERGRLASSTLSSEAYTTLKAKQGINFTLDIDSSFPAGRLCT